MGIQGHIWYKFLDQRIAQPVWKNVFKKVLLDQTIAAPIYTTTYIIGKFERNKKERSVIYFRFH